MRALASASSASMVSPIAGATIPAYATGGSETTSSAWTVAPIAAANCCATARAAWLSGDALYATPILAIGSLCWAKPRDAIATAHEAPLSAARVSSPSTARPNALWLHEPTTSRSASCFSACS